MVEFASLKTSLAYVAASNNQKSAQEVANAAVKDVTGKLQQKGITAKEKDELNKRLESLTKGGAPEFIALKEANAALSNFEIEKKNL
jgi:Asp-tRNA(Asn)/Glu-tRNA(Gln) amidotransferase B subunit